MTYNMKIVCIKWIIKKLPLLKRQQHKKKKVPKSKTNNVNVVIQYSFWILLPLFS